MQSKRWKLRRLEPPVLVINCKNYRSAWGEGGLRLARLAEEASMERKVSVGIAPASPFLGYMSGRTRLPIFAQHVDAKPEGATTGFLLPEAIREAGCVGSILNHSEHKLSTAEVGSAICILRKLGLKSLVCAVDVHEVRRLARLRPDFLAVEPPELIGTGISVSKAKPEVIVGAVNAIKEISSDTCVLCGAGVTTGEDVEVALRLGSQGILVSSGIVGAKDWKLALDDLIIPLAGAELT